MDRARVPTWLPIILLGDFNADRQTNNAAADQLILFMETNSLSQHITAPTHVTPTRETKLDLILTNLPDLISNPGNTPPIDYNDHDTIFGTINIQLDKKKPYYREMWNFKEADFEAFREELAATDWDPCFTTQDPNKACDDWNKTFLGIAKNHVKVKKVLVRPSSQPWYTNDLRRFAREKHRARMKAQRSKTDADWADFRRLRNEYKDKTDAARLKYETTTLKDLANKSLLNPKRWWDLAKKVLGYSKIAIPSLLYKGEVLSSDKDKAQAFNETYLASGLLEDDGKDIPPDPDPNLGNLHPIEDFDITEQEVIDMLKGVDPSKAYGPDGISPRLLKEAGGTIAGSLARLFNLSLVTGIFPATWKLANILPIYKKADPSTTTNYRPVSLLSRVSTIFERIIFKHMFNYFRENFLISIWQSGFLPGSSTITQLLELYDQFCKAIDERKEVRIVFLDISKAFDRVWHKGLLHKLEKNGISGRLLSWLKDYLTDRYQRVVLNGQNSDWGRITAGVPQGSVLGPLLFLIFINDLTHVIRHCKIRLFADDTCLFIEVDDPDVARNCIQSDLDNIQTWAQNWLVAFSPAKSKDMVLSLKRNKPVHQQVRLANEGITRVESHKHLGISLSSDLKWSTHIMEIAKKACKRLNILRPLKMSMDRKTLELLYFTFVRSQMEYGDILWDIPNPHDRSLDILETVQINAARLVTGGIARSSVAKLYGELKWVPLAKRREQHRLLQFYKIANNLAPTYLIDILPAQVHERTVYQLRNRDNLDVPLARLNRYLYSFFPATTRDWNKLQDTIKNAPSIKAFKSRLAGSSRRAPAYYYKGVRRWAVYHTRMRLNCSPLNSDLCHKMFVVASSACECGHANEDAYHFFRDCPRYALIRPLFLAELARYGPFSIRNILFGNQGLIDDLNLAMFELIQNFIRDSGRFN
jgi:hypothetical protein